jgi:hypothetical protein
MAKRIGNKKKRIIYRYQCTGGCDMNRYTFNYELMKKGVCRKCQLNIPPEGLASLFDPVTDSDNIANLVENTHNI